MEMKKKKKKKKKKKVWPLKDEKGSPAYGKRKISLGL